MRTRTCILAFLLSLSVCAQQSNEPIVYPNPVGDEMSVRVSSEVQEVVVHDLIGNELALQKLADDHGLNVVSVTLPVERFPSGVYVVSLCAEGNRVLECERFKVLR